MIVINTDKLFIDILSKFNAIDDMPNQSQYIYRRDCRNQFLSKKSSIKYNYRKFDPKIYKKTPYPGYYAGKDGTIYSERRGITLSPRIDKDGYHEVSLMYKGKVVARSVHRLIADAWLPNPKNKPFVNHKNGNRDDNRVSNLEWVTISENNLGKNKDNGHTYVYDDNGHINREKSHLPPKTK